MTFEELGARNPIPAIAGAVLAASLLWSCGGGDGLPRRGVAFDSAFRAEAQVALEEAEDDPVVEVSSLSLRPGGGFLVVDGPAGRVRAFGPAGDRQRVFGRPGGGPGELRQPSHAAAGPEGALYVVQRGGPRLTRYGPDGSPSSFDLPAHYGHWVAPLGDRLAVGLGTTGPRYGVITRDGELVRSFASRRPSPADYPSGNYIVRDNEAAAGDRVVVNTSLSPRVRVYDRDGDSVRSFGEPPPSWKPAEPPSGELAGGLDESPESRAWLTSFTVVTGLATLGDSLVVVQYGRFDPVPEDADRLVRETVDVYRIDGTKLLEDVPLEEPVLAGGDRLYTLGSAPPGPWTLNAYAWSGASP